MKKMNSLTLKKNMALKANKDLRAKSEMNNREARKDRQAKIQGNNDGANVKENVAAAVENVVVGVSTELSNEVSNEVSIGVLNGVSSGLSRKEEIDLNNEEVVNLTRSLNQYLLRILANRKRASKLRKAKAKRSTQKRYICRSCARTLKQRTARRQPKKMRKNKCLRK